MDPKATQGYVKELRDGGIAPGEYTLLAFESLEEGEWQEPDFITRYESHGELIKLEEEARQSKQLTVIR